jgi:hypothetical protein
MISTAFSLTTVFLLAVTASVQDAAEIQPDVFVRFVEGDASAFALMAEWSTTYKKWELLQRDVNTKYTKTTDLTPCMLTCQRDDAKKEMQCTDSYRQTSIDLQQKALTAGAVTPLVCTTTETQTTGSLGLECQASSTDNFLRIVVNMVKETALPSVQCSPKAIAAGVEITCSTTDSTISKLSYFFLGITGQKIDGTSIIIPWDTFQPGTNPILILVTLGNGDLHYFSITVDADLIYTVCDVQISFLDADQRNMRFGIQASLQKNISIDGGTYYVHNTLGSKCVRIFSNLSFL